MAGPSKTRKKDTKQSAGKPIISLVAAVVLVGVVVVLMTDLFGSDGGSTQAETVASDNTVAAESGESTVVPTSPSRPPVSVTPGAVEFGEVLVNTTVERTVQLTNTSDRPLRVLTTRSSCSCTTGSVGGQVLQPRASLPLKVTFNSEHTGRRTATLSVVFEGFDEPFRVGTRAQVLAAGE